MLDINFLINKGANIKIFDPKEIIYTEGTECIYYHQLVTGRVVWGNSNEEGKEFIQKIIEPGEFFGELPLFDDGVYAADAIAIKTSEVIRLPKSIFLEILRENPQIHFQFSRVLAQRLRFDFRLLKSFAFENPEERICTLLSYFKCQQKSKKPMQVMLTRQQIANMTGLRVETVIRAILALHEKGELNIIQGKVYI
jgi:CRP/FNR family cyclic AMP-dependent transcriptional regulator